MMDLFKRKFLWLVVITLSLTPSLISSAPQTGSSFFYYYSPNQPMVVNSQTFGSNPQAYHHTGKPGVSPFDFIPSDQTQNQNQNFRNFIPPSNPFLPQRNTNPNVNPYSQPQPGQNPTSSLLDKIAFTHGPPLATPTSNPSISSQYQYSNYRLNPPPTPQPQPSSSPTSLTSNFPGQSTSFATANIPGQAQPSAKLFNFLNQPFQFFQSSFNNRFQQQQQQPVQQQDIYDVQDLEDEQNYDDVSNSPPQQVKVKGYVTPPTLVTHPVPPALPQPGTEQTPKSYYTYYDTGSVPSRYAGESPKTTPLTFSVKQYFMSKTTKGPASYTFTIEANPTLSPRPTAQVHVSVGSDTLPATFPTLPPSLFTVTRPPSTSGGESGRNESATAVPDKVEENKNHVDGQEMSNTEEKVGPTTTPTPQTTTTPSTPSTSTTTETPKPQPEVSQVEIELQLELVPPALSPQPEVKVVEPPSSSAPPTSTIKPETTPTPTSTTISPTLPTTPPQINIEQENVYRSKVEGRRPVKRVIVRKKLATGERVRLTEADLNSRSIVEERPQQNDLSTPEKVPHLEDALPSASHPTEMTLTTTTPNPAPITIFNKKQKFRSTHALMVSTTTIPKTTPTPENPNPVAAASFDTPTTFRYNSIDFRFKDDPSTSASSPTPSFIYHPTTTTTEDVGVVTTSTSKPEISTPSQVTTTTLQPEEGHRSSTKATVKIPEVANNEYEYYYYDEQTERSSSSTSTTTQTPSTGRSTLRSTTTTATPTTEPSSPSTTEVPTDLHNDYYDHQDQATTIPSIFLEEEFIEPLSTTEETSSSTSTPSTTETPEEEKIMSTEKVVPATTERISITTYRPHFSLDETEPEVTTSATTSTSTTPTTTPQPTPDYDDVNQGVEIGGGEIQQSSQNVQNSEVDTPVGNSTDSITPEIMQNETFLQTGNISDVTLNLTSDPFPHHPSDDFLPHPDEYFSSQEEYIASDPLEDERIHEAQLNALNTALKNIRNRQQNSSTTEKPTEDDSSKIKYVRKPTKVNSFPSSTSVSVSYSSHEVDDEELGDSRSNIINKIQTFRTKLRKVVNRTGRKSTTTKRPRRVTRPTGLTSTSSTAEPLTELEHLEVEPHNGTLDKVTVEVPQQRSVGKGGSEVNFIDIEEKLVPQTTTTTTSTTPTPTPPPTTTTTVPTLSTPQEIVTPKVLGSLIITEILPTTTHPSTTTTTQKIIPDNNDQDQQSLDFETEENDSEISSSTTSTTTTTTELSPTFSPSLTEVTSTENDVNNVIVETSTSRTIRERKVKVVLKRRKGAPKGTGTVARQVVRTRTRVLRREEIEGQGQDPGQGQVVVPRNV